MIWYIWLSAKRCACKGLCTSVENKTLLKTVFIWNVVLCTCMNEWIYSTDNFSNQAVVDFKIQSSHTKKVPKNDHQKWTSMYRVIFVILLTNRKHMEKQSLICTRKTSFYTDNITSTLTIVVFSINWSRMFALYVHQMCCKLELKTLNNRKTTASLRNHRKHRVCSDPCICTTQQYSFFFSKVLHEILRIFPQSFDIVVISDVPTRYLIFCTKQTRKQSLFYRQHPERHATFPRVTSFFSAAWRVFVRKHRKVCCSLLQWCDVGTVVWCRTCTVRFFRSVFRLFSSFPPIWVCEMKVLWKVASSCAEDLKPDFFILGRVQREGFHYDKAISCKCYMQLLIQDVYSISSKTCQL